jgi:hypothetical protein
VEIHVYLNGRLQAKTSMSRRDVIETMAREHGATLFHEWPIRTPSGSESYLKLRFVTPNPVAGDRAAANFVADAAKRDAYALR